MPAQATFGGNLCGLQRFNGFKGSNFKDSKGFKMQSPHQPEAYMGIEGKRPMCFSLHMCVTVCRALP